MAMRSDSSETSDATLRKRALDLLARREHSRGELARKLAQKGAMPAQVAAVLDECAAQGLQSDARFAEALVTSRVRRGQGALRIRSELAERGVAEALIEAALAQAGVDWCALARDVCRRKYGAEPASDWAEHARRARFLGYRGFDAGVIREALATVAEAAGEQR
jgi:regulatory protein